jgi:hypothetical protein
MLGRFLCFLLPMLQVGNLQLQVVVTATCRCTL